MPEHTRKVDDEFEEVVTHTVDDRNRITLGALLEGTRKVRVYRNARGELLLQPLMEIPASEVWRFQNQEALKAVKQGLDDAVQGRIFRLDLDTL